MTWKPPASIAVSAADALYLRPRSVAWLRAGPAFTCAWYSGSIPGGWPRTWRRTRDGIAALAAGAAVSPVACASGGRGSSASTTRVTWSGEAADGRVGSRGGRRLRGVSGGEDNY